MMPLLDHVAPMNGLNQCVVSMWAQLLCLATQLPVLLLLAAYNCDADDDGHHEQLASEF